MRFYCRRIALIACGSFFTTIILLSVNSRDSDSEWLANGGARKFTRPVPRDIKNYLPNSRNDASTDIEQYFASNVDQTLVQNFENYLSQLDIWKLIAAECPMNETLRQFWRRTKGTKVPDRDSWEAFYADIGSCDLYRNHTVINNLLNDLSRLPIKKVAIMEGGTQVKLIFTFENDQQAVFKPMRFGRDYETNPNHFYFSDFERHHAEIATFHLDKILGFRRAVPTVGRVLNMTSELYEKAEKRLKRTFFISPAKNHCFVSKCDYYCDTTHAICGNPVMKEGSVQVFLPDEASVPRRHNKSPYRRTYSKRNQIAPWQENMNYCDENVKTKKLFAHGRQLLDLIDLHILDYIIGMVFFVCHSNPSALTNSALFGNQDRHHYESLNVFGQPTSYIIHIDNGRAFGRTDIDDEDILLPLRQCCIVRPSTVLKLFQFYKGPVSLTRTLHQSMSRDPAAPILATKHYPAMERRLHKVIAYIDECIRKQPDGVQSVIMAEFHNKEVALDNQLADEEMSDETKIKKADRKNNNLADKYLNANVDGQPRHQ